MKNWVKKIKYKLEFYDGVWSIPLAFGLFFVGGWASFKYFGDSLISIQYIQEFILAAFAQIFCNFVVLLGARFNFKSLQKYFYSKEIKERVNKDLSTWQRVCLYLFVYFGLTLEYLMFLWLIMTVTQTTAL